MIKQQNTESFGKMCPKRIHGNSLVGRGGLHALSEIFLIGVSPREKMCITRFAMVKNWNIVPCDLYVQIKPQLRENPTIFANTIGNCTHKVSRPRFWGPSINIRPVCPTTLGPNK